jgi:hypothetical protein
VHFLWMDRHGKLFFTALRWNSSHRRSLSGLSRPASLARDGQPHTIRRRFGLSAARSSIVTTPVHRFEESIAGRPYLIEVAAVSKDRWRAYIVRLPGVPTALMPFYGETPAEAAGQLRDWLTRAHERAANGVRRV